MGWRDIVRWPWRYDVFLVKRTKQAPAGKTPSGEVTTRPVVHYAMHVEPNGSISSWTSARDDASPIMQSACEKVQAYYQARGKTAQAVKRIGKLEFEPTKATAAQLARAEAGATAMANDDLKRLQDANAKLTADNKALRAAAEDAKAQYLELSQKVESASKLSQSREAEITILSDRVAQLERDLEAATKPAGNDKGKPEAKK